MVRTFRRFPWVRRAVAALAILMGGALLAVVGMSLAAAVSASPSPVDAASTPAAAPAPSAGTLDPLKYSIHTRYAAGTTGPCAGDRTVPAVIGIPSLVDIGGNFLPDATVTVVAVPGVGGAPDVLQLVVTKLVAGPLRALVEVIITPDSALPGRIAAGPDGCESGIPGTFSATVSSSDARLSVVATSATVAPDVTVLGSTFDAVGTTRANATKVSARLSPVPTFVQAVVDINGPGSYRAHVETSQRTDLDLTYSNTNGAASLLAGANVRTFPGKLDLTFTDERISYTASAPMNQVDLALASVTPGERSDVMKVNLTGVPVTATLLRPSPTQLTFTTPTGPGVTPTSIGSAVMTFAEFEPGTTIPTLTPEPDQYLVTRVETDFTVATARVLGLSRADIDSGDPVLVDVKHAAGPFHVVADLVGTETRHLDVDVLALPATAKVTYSPTTQAFTYDGSAVIDELTADVTSSVPFVGNADESHLRVLSLPTGLTGRLDAVAKRFTATMTGGSLGTLEVGVTSGLNQKLPEGQQGLLLEDHPALIPSFSTYDAFVRVRGLEAATVSWGDNQVADITHLPGPFTLQVDTPDLTVDGTIQDLPHQAYVYYGAVVPTPPENAPPVPPIGHPGDLDPGWDPPPGQSFVYRGSDPISLVTLDVSSSQPLFDDATEAHIDVHGLPKEVVVSMLQDAKQAVVATKNGPVGSIDIELCSDGACDPASSVDDPAPDGLRVDDLKNSYHATAHLTGLTRLELSWGDVVGVRLLHDARRFDIDLTEDKTAGEFSEVEYQVRTNVVIDAVPADAKLTYDPASQHVTYRGSSPIGSIDARRTIGEGVNTGDNSPVTMAGIVGRATSAHLVVTGLPTGLDLTFQFADSNEKLVIDAGTSAVGHISLDLLSSPDLLGYPEFAGHPIVQGTRDGLQYWDLDDFVTPEADPVDDLFAIVVRVTGLQRFVSRLDNIPATGGTVDDRYLELTRQGSGLPDLVVQIVRAESTAPVQVVDLDEDDKPYKYDSVDLTYTAPPAKLGFWMRQIQGEGQQMEFKYFGSAPGGRIDFRTDVGAGLRSLDLAVFPIPAGGGTLASPGLAACFSPDAMWCHDEREVDGANNSEVSMELHVTEPIRLEVDASTADRHHIVTQLNVSRVLIVSKEKRVDPIDDNTFLFIDTEGTPIDGFFKVFDDGDRDISAHIPKGFRAYARFVELLALDIGDSGGRLVCPAGFDVEEDWGINLEGRICPNPRLDSVTGLGAAADMSISGPGEYQFLLEGTNFVPWIDGVPGTVVGFYKHPNDLSSYDDKFEVTNVQWNEIGELLITVQVHEGVDSGSRSVTVFNPIDYPGKRDSIGNVLEVE